MKKIVYRCNKNNCNLSVMRGYNDGPSRRRRSDEEHDDVICDE
jgi:hypothetical protein